jgi:hypothetical protein
MVALACLRIFIGSDAQFADPRLAASVVAKAVNAYLEIRWEWPRRFGAIAPFAFALADPNLDEIDTRELQALAESLHLRLFGQRGEGEVTLLTFDGDPVSVSRFAKADRAEMARLLAGEDDGVLMGRVTRITRDAVTVVVPQGRTLPGPRASFDMPPRSQSPITYHGVYNVPRQAFIGSAYVPGLTVPSTALDSVVPPLADILGDGGLDDALRALAAAEGRASGFAFIPLSFHSLNRPRWRAAFVERAGALRLMRRQDLVATVTHTPRAPSFQSLTAIKAALEPYFRHLDLRVEDPGFRLDEVPPGLATSVTLALSGIHPQARSNAIARFTEAAPQYRTRRLWQSVGNIDHARELAACVKGGVTFVSGPAVCASANEPMGAMALPLSALPLDPSEVAPPQVPRLRERSQPGQ